jgi:hypothetical protein
MRNSLVFLSVSFLVACASAESGAKKEFSKTYVCPNDRITAKVRKDINGYDLQWGPYVYKEPPADIKADPGRLAVWNSQQEEEKGRHNSWWSDYKTIEVSGCDFKVFYSCSTYDDGEPSCDQRDYKEQIIPDKTPH